MTIDELAAKMHQGFVRLEQKIDRGFNDSKTRDQRLEGLIIGLEAREVLRDEMHRRLDTADRKNDEQTTLPEDAVQHLNTRK